jgi:cysteine-rich repeat protein
MRMQFIISYMLPVRGRRYLALLFLAVVSVLGSCGFSSHSLSGEPEAQAEAADEEFQVEMDASDVVDLDARENESDRDIQEDSSHTEPDDDSGEEGAGFPCGDGLIEGSEECDDGNTAPGDGCEADCRYTCHDDTECDDANDCTSDACDLASHLCGHRPRERGAPCDDRVYCTLNEECDGAGRCVGTPAPELYGVTAVAAGALHTCAVTNTGGVVCWGKNDHGQLGDGSTMDRLSPVDVSGLASGVRAVTAGESHTCALLDTGGVKCWGYNWYGQLGDRSTLTRTSPVGVYGLSSGVTAIAAGGDHTCALLDAGGVKCWGSGSLGDGTYTDRFEPVDVSGLFSGAIAIAAGHSHTCAVLGPLGNVKCWGGNYGGELGDGTTHSSTIPVDVLDLRGATSIAAGSFFTCASLRSGSVRCWGDNSYGQLGNDSTDDSSVPVDVSGLTSGVTAVAAGFHYNCALLDTGGVQCWGNDIGSSNADSSAPATVPGLSSGVIAIAAGGSHSCAILASGILHCWGENNVGQLGRGFTITRTTPVYVPGLSAGATALTAGPGHSCAVLATGGAVCWGSGYLGDGSTRHSDAPIEVSGLSPGVIALAAGSFHTCALLETGGVQCWGANWYGQLGDGSTTDRTTPVDVAGLSSGVTAIAAGEDHTCAIMGTGGMKCWGDNAFGKLGDGSTTDRTTPVDVAGLSSGVTAAAAGLEHTCALLDTGGAQCWGQNYEGQLGNGTTSSYSTTSPVDVLGLTNGATAISAGYYHTCCLLGTGGAQCWGSNGNGQLGDGRATLFSTTPVDVSGLSSGATGIAVGSYFSCALTGTGGVKCWGDNEYGQIGDGSTTRRNAPVDVSGLSFGASAVATGYSHACALLDSGAVQCWGNDAAGQVTGSFSGYPHPVLCM